MRAKTETETEIAQATDFDVILREIGFGKVQWRLIFSCGLLMLCVMCEIMGMSIIVIASQCELKTDNAQKSLITNAAYIGGILSSYYWGYTADISGRRQLLLYTTFLSNLSSFVSALMPNMALFVFMRFTVGFFLAGPSVLVLSYAAEFTALHLRPLVINGISLFTGIAMIYTPIVAWVLLSQRWCIFILCGLCFRTWRLLLLFYMLPGFVGGLILLQLPESPKFLLSIGKTSEAFQVMEWICKRNTGKNLKDFDIIDIKAMEVRQQQLKEVRMFKLIFLETRPLLRKPHIQNLLKCSIIMFVLFLISNGLGLWFPFICNFQESAEQNNVTICELITHAPVKVNHTCDDSINSYRSLIILGCANIVGFSILGFLLKYFARKKVFIGSLLVSCLCGYSLSWASYPILIGISFALFLMLPGILVSVLCGALVDLIPTHLRSKALCFCLICGRLGAIVGSQLSGALLEKVCFWTLNTFAAFMSICIIIALTVEFNTF